MRIWRPAQMSLLSSIPALEARCSSVERLGLLTTTVPLPGARERGDTEALGKAKLNRTRPRRRHASIKNGVVLIAAT